MRRAWIGLAMTAVALSAAHAGAPATAREVKMKGVVVAGSTLPEDLTSPEGKTRWHLESVPLGPSRSMTIGADGSVAVVPAGDATAAGATQRYALSGPGADRWLFPDHDPAQLKIGSHNALTFDETRDGLVDHLVAETATVGIGWVHLPSGPKEAVLERIVLMRQRAGERAMRPEALIHRWINPQEGIVAEISGPLAGDGRTRASITSASVLDYVVTGAADLKLYADQVYRGTRTDILYGWDRGAGTTPGSLVPDPGINNACDLVNLSTWNFSGVNSGNDCATTDVASVPTESCNTGRCGYQGYPTSGTVYPPLLERLDRNLTGTLRKDNEVVQREDRATDVTFWLRAGAQNENKTGAFGTGESRFCFTDETGKPREEVPLWQMQHNDVRGWYAQVGDTWSSAPVVSPTCQETFYTLVCGSSQPLTPNPLYGRACTNSGQTYAGNQALKIVKSGVVTVPSGHTLNALVVRNTTDFCVYIDSSCAILTDRVKTIVYYWAVPYLGSVALIRGPRKVDYASGETGETPCTNFTSLDFTDIGYGLFPPLSISVGTVTDTSVQLSWNPGNDAHRLSGYKIYWDTDPGASTDYGFNSATNAGQVSFVGTTATISGLTPGTPYYFTVTSLSNFTDPSSSVVTTYESIRYPTTVSGDPSFAYPVEVTATTTGGTCIPQQQITGLTVDKSTPNVHVCWNATADPCAVGYDVLGSNDVTSDVNWTVVGQVGLTTCWDGNPSQQYLLVRARGTGGNGPWGHYNH